MRIAWTTYGKCLISVSTLLFAIRRMAAALPRAAVVKVGLQSIIRTEQNRTEQNRTEQNRTEQNRTEQVSLTDREYWNRFGGRFNRYKQPCETDGRQNGEIRKKIISWDVAPEREYFEQLFRISRNQIIWGANYFDLPPTRCFVVWEKINIPEDFTMAMCEYAWTSFNANAKIFKYSSIRDKTSGGFHPTEKPIALYTWLLENFAEKNDTIIDTHVGSASSLIACRETGHKYIGFEIDETYYKLAKERLDRATAQVNIFDLLQPKAEQITMFGESEET